MIEKAIRDTEQLLGQSWDSEADKWFTAALAIVASEKDKDYSQDVNTTKAPETKRIEAAVATDAAKNANKAGVDSEVKAANASKTGRLTKGEYTRAIKGHKITAGHDTKEYAKAKKAEVRKNDVVAETKSAAASTYMAEPKLADAGGTANAKNGDAAKTNGEIAKAKEIDGPRGGILDTVVGNTVNTSARIPAAYTAAISSDVANSDNARQLAVAAAEIPLNDNNKNSKDSMVILLNELAPDH